MDMGIGTPFILGALIFYLTKIVIFFGGSVFLLWVAFRYLPRGWGRRALVIAVPAFWIVDLVPGAIGFRILCQIHAGIEVNAAVVGRPEIMIGGRIPPEIAARILALSGGVEYQLAPNVAGRVGLVPGLYRLRTLEEAQPDCFLVALRGKPMLTRCAEADLIAAPTARYLLDAEPGSPDGMDGRTDAGPFDLSWWVEKHAVFVVDRDTDTTLASATLLLRRRIPSLTGLLSFSPKDAACPRGAIPEGLPYLLLPAAFPDLTGRRL